MVNGKEWLESERRRKRYTKIQNFMKQFTAMHIRRDIINFEIEFEGQKSKTARNKKKTEREKKPFQENSNTIKSTNERPTLN